MSRFQNSLAVILILAVGMADLSCKKSESNPTGPGTTGTAFLKGIVTNVANSSGSPVAGATVGTGSGSSVATGAGGDFTLPVPPGTQVKVSVTKSGFSLNEMQVNIPDGVTKTVSVGLLQVGSTQPVSVPNGGSAASGGFTVNLPPGFVAPPAGGASSVSVSVTGVDPTTTEVRALPGDLTAIDSTGAPKFLNPISCAEYSAKDANGNALPFNQSSGTGAQVELPIPEAMRGQPGFTMGDAIECYAYDSDTGKWKNPVRGVVGPSTVDGTPVIKATVRKLGWLGGAIAVDQQSTISGSVKNGSGAGMSGVAVEAFPGSSTTTDAQGHYQVSASPNSNVRVVATLISGTSVQTAEVNVFTGNPGSSDSAPDITLGSSQQTQFTIDAYLFNDPTGGSAAAIVSDSSGTYYDGANIVLHVGSQTFPLDTLGSASGYYYLNSIAFAQGQLYTITVDIDRNGTTDAMGQILMVGNTTITNPQDNGTVGARFTATWVDSATGVSGYSASYYVSVTGDSSSVFFRTTVPSKEIGDGTIDSSFYGIPQPNDPLIAGSYSIDVTAYNGPAEQFLGYGNAPPNISGQNVNGYFYAYASAPTVYFTSTGQGAVRSATVNSVTPPIIQRMIARMPGVVRKQLHLNTR